jgi:predicted RNA-binding Zn-ribbon protein involved in translation (DUF1610 family)
MTKPEVEVHQGRDPESAAVMFSCPKCGSFNVKGITLKTWNSTTNCLNCGEAVQIPDERYFST